MRTHPRLSDHWRLIAYDTAHADLRHFLVMRMQHLETTEITFDWPADFDPVKHLDGTVGAFVGGPVCDIRIALAPDAAVCARERPWHASQQLRKRPDGWTEMTLRLSDLPGIRNPVLRWGAHAAVLQPASLRAEVKASLASALSHYAQSVASRPESARGSVAQPGGSGPVGPDLGRGLWRDKTKAGHDQGRALQNARAIDVPWFENTP